MPNFEIHDNWKIQVGKPLDERYGPYSSRDAALSALPSYRRHIGLVVGAITTVESIARISEYIFRDGIADENLILREANVSEGVGIRITQGADGSKVINARISTYRQQFIGVTSKKLVLEFTPTLVIMVMKDGEALFQGSGEGFYLLEDYTNVIQLNPTIMADTKLIVVYEHDIYAPLPVAVSFDNPDVAPAGVTIALVTADNYVSLAESSQTINISGTVTGEFQTGDIVSLGVGGNIFSGTVTAAGRWSIPVPGSVLINAPSAIIAVTAQLTNSLQNLVTVMESHVYTRYTDAGGAPISCSLLDEVGGPGLRTITMEAGSTQGLTGITYEVLAGQVSISLTYDGVTVASVVNATTNGSLTFNKVTSSPTEVIIVANSSDPTANWRIIGQCPISI